MRAEHVNDVELASSSRRTGSSRIKNSTGPGGRKSRWNNVCCRIGKISCAQLIKQDSAEEDDK